MASNVIKPKSRTGSTGAPDAAALQDGEIAVNVTERTIYINSGGAVVPIANFSIGGASNWDDIAGKPTITDFARTLLDDADAPAMRATLGLGTAATAASSSFAAASHAHTIANVTGLQTALDGKVSAASLGGVGYDGINVTGFYRPSNDAGSPNASADADVLHIQHSGGDASQLAFVTTNDVKFRVKDDATNWGSWATLWHSANFDPASKAAAVHTHSGADITSGTVAAARLGSGTASSGAFLRGDGAWSSSLFATLNLVIDPASGGGRALNLGGRSGTSAVASDGNNYIDFYSANVTDPSNYQMRLIRWQGVNGLGDWQHRGTGDMRMLALDAANLLLMSGGVSKLSYSAASNVWTVPTTVGWSHASLAVNGSAGTARRMRINTAGVVRWEFGGDGSAESGGNKGTDFVFQRALDDGTVVNVWTAVRETGAMKFSVRPEFSGATPWDSANFSPSSKADAAHTHSGADITSGTVADARLPTTMAGKTFSSALVLSGAADNRATMPGRNGYNDLQLNYSAGGNVGFYDPTAAGWRFRVDANGLVAVAHIPDLAISKITGLQAALDAAGATSAWGSGISSSGTRIASYSASGDLDLARGFHAVYANDTANRPSGGNGVVWGLSATVGGTDYGVQEHGQLGRRFFRTLFNDAWGGWNEYWHSGNLNLAEVVMTHGNQTITGSKTFQGHILGGTDDWRIYQNTTDGADNRRIVVHAGGAVSNSRGAYLLLQGNEYAGGTDAGGATLTSGLNADLSLVAPGSGSVRVVSTTGAFTFNGSDVWHAGNFAPSNYLRLDTSLQQISTAVSDWRIAAQTAVGSDTLALRLQSGGAFNTSRGGILELNGANASSTWAGGFRLLGASGSTSQINGGTGSTVHMTASTFEFTSTSTALFSGVTRFRSGTVGAQRVHTSFGWNDGVQRWTTAMEGDATFSFYNYDTGGSTASRLLNLIGANMGAARLMVFGEVVGHLEGGAAGQVRMVGGNYGAFFRNDGTNLYLLMTASGDQFGSYNTLRPLTVNVSTGLVTAGNGLALGSSVGASNTDLSKHIALYGSSYGFSVTGSRLNYVAPNSASHMFVVNGTDAVAVAAANQAATLSVAGGIWTAGPNAVVHMIDRTTSRQWGWYGSADVLRLWNGTSDVLTVDSSGRVSIKGGPLLTQESGELRIEGTWRTYSRPAILAANSAAWVRQPRIFTGPTDPGAQAEDGDIWIP